MVSGDLTFATVREVYEQSLGFAHQLPLPTDIDLEAVEKADSAGLALLLEWQSWARKKNHLFHFVRVPERLRELARMAEADKILEFEENNDQVVLP